MRLRRSHRAQVAQYEWTLLQTDNCGVDHMAEPHSSGHYDSCGADRQTCTVYVTLLVQVAVEWEYPGQLIAVDWTPY